MNPAEFLTISSAVLPDREALVSGASKKRITYAEMGSRVNRLSNALRAMGAGPGARVAVMATNSPEYVEVYYACAKLGACFVPLNFRAKREELAYMLNASESSIVFVGDRYQELLASVRPELTTVHEVVSLEGGIRSLKSFDNLVAGASDEDAFADVDEDEPTALIFTSGTTALPKGVELSSLWGGRTLVILPQFDPELWLETVQRERVTHAFVVPTMLKRIMDYAYFDRFDLSSLQLLTYGAAPMPFDVVCRAIEVFSCDLMNAYGQTESTSSLTYLGPDDHRLNGTAAENAKKLHRLRSVGRAMDDVEIAILGGDGSPVAAGGEGEICVRSARVMKEYLKQSDATAAVIVDGWLHTGDVGFLDADVDD